MKWLGILALLILLISGGMASAQQTEEEIMKFNSFSYMHEDPPIKEPVLVKEGMVKMPTRSKEVFEKNTMVEKIMSAEAKMNAMQNFLAANPMSMRDMMSLIVAKKKVLPGITFDEVIESIKVKANELNLKFSGHNKPWKILREMGYENSPKVEFLVFCDLVTLRKLLDYSLEFTAFLPCRVAVMEDAYGQIWITTIDWDARWLDSSSNPNQMPAELLERASRVREQIETIMEAGATGDF